MTSERDVVLNLEPVGFSDQARELWETVGEYVEGDLESEAANAVATRVTVLIVRLRRRIGSELLGRFPRLRWLVSATTGLDHLDGDAIRVRGIRLLSLRDEQEFLRTIPSTAEMTFALMAALVRYVPAAHAAVLRGEWNRDRFRGRQLRDRKLGLVGLGRTGQMVASYARAFGMPVGFYDPYVEPVHGCRRFESLDALLGWSEIVSLHVHLTEETRGVIGANLRTSGCRSVYLINTSRGAIVEEDQVVRALEDGVLAGMATDVLATELDSIADNRLVAAARRGLNVIVTPHLGGATSDAMQACEEHVAKRFVELTRAESCPVVSGGR